MLNACKYIYCCRMKFKVLRAHLNFQFTLNEMSIFFKSDCVSDKLGEKRQTERKHEGILSIKIGLFEIF